MLADISPVTLSLAPILGTLVVVLFSVWILYRQTAHKADARREVDEWKQSILRRDAENDEAFVDHIVRGLAVDQAITQFQKNRRDCLPTAHPAAPHLWTIEQLEQQCRQLLREKIEAINGAMLVRWSSITAGAVAVCAVTLAVLYNFESSPAVPIAPAHQGLPPLPPPLLNSPLLNSPAPLDPSAPALPPAVSQPAADRAADSLDEAAPAAEPTRSTET